MYLIRGADQKEYGPVSAEMIRQWLAERRAGAQTLAREEGSDEWKPIGSWPEFQAALSPTLAHPAAGSPPNGLAITSMVLGVIALFCLGPITGIPALILGIVALSRAHRQPQLRAGNGFAIAGITLGSLSFITLFFLAGLFLPAFAKAREKAMSISCVNNLKQIGLAANVYANDHAGVYPDDFAAFAAMGFSPGILRCPSDDTKSIAIDWDRLSLDNISYTWHGAGLRDDRYPNFILSHCPIHGHVLQADGAVIANTSR